jgi:3-deoxy-manno-octulosonate cytidylyltransferase (CMP-KDO synthetase)
MTKILGVIPARMGSTRYPGKPLVMIQDRPMIQRVWEGCQKSKFVQDWIVATDHISIFEAVVQFGGKAIMTDLNHASGTDRCIEAWQKSSSDYTHIINVQGDEPLIESDQIDTLLKKLLESDSPIATLVKRSENWDEFHNPNRVKVAIDGQGKALYFSRSPIPFQKREAFHFFWKHIGMYAFSSAGLASITHLPMSPLERSESLEQLRWLESGMRIQTAETELETPSVDTPEDLQPILDRLSSKI